MWKEKSIELIPNPEHLAKLQEGAEVWNVWYGEQKGLDDSFKAELQGANLKGTRLERVNLIDAQLQGADFREAYLTDAHLNNALLKGANFSYARLQGANLESACLKGINLSNTQLQGAKLSGAQLEGANLSNAQLQDARLIYANLRGAKLQDANLTNAILSYVKGLRFSDNKIKDAVITSTTTAPWLILKKSYTNTMMLFTLAAVFAFFLPYVVNVATWRSVNLAQQLNSELEATLIIVADELEKEKHSLATVIRRLSNKAENTTECLAEECKYWPIWKLLLGVRRNWAFAFLSVVLIIYNMLRIFLTQQVSILRDSEQATGLTPHWETTYFKLFGVPVWPIGGYQHLHYMHQVVRIVFWIALISFAVHSIAWLKDGVFLPVIL